MKELQVAKVRDFKGESLLPTVRYRGRGNKKTEGGDRLQKEKDTEREREGKEAFAQLLIYLGG